MKKNIQKNFLQQVSRKTLYLATLFAVAAVAVAGFLLVPNFNNGTVSAQDRVNAEKATNEMLSISLDFKTATDFAILADRGISDAGNSRITGNVGVAGKDAQIDLARASVQGKSFGAQDVQVDMNRAQKDLAGAFNAINQLPCTDVAESDLGGRKFTSGVYCVSSARLAGQITLDGENDPAAIFVFRITGSLNTKDGSSISLLNAAQAPNVFFVASDSINIGKNSDFRGSILAQNSIKVDTGSTVSGRALSLKGDVSLDGATVVLADGTLEICKVVDANAPGAFNLNGRIFQFTVGGLTIEAPANGCSNPFTVTAGPVVITEQNTSREPNSTVMRVGNFQLTDVRQINRQAGAANAVTGFNLPLKTANVTVPMGGVESQVTVQFTNQFAIVAFIEICKQALDGDVAGFFRYTIDGVPQQTSLPAEPLQVFTTPAGSCVGPIAVTVPSDGAGTPRQGIVTVRELAQVGFFFVTATTNPANRLLTVQVVNNTTTAGIVTARVFEADTTTNTSNQTTINFFNRSNPGRIKICKVAGPGIVEGTPFNFTVTGTGPVFDPATGAFTTQAITRTLTVQAGPANATQNGFCAFVPIPGNPLVAEQFVVGTNATITEDGPLVTANGNEIRVARITSTSGFVTPAIAGNVYFPPNGTTRTVTVPVRREVVEVEYTNFVFSPGQLKICKVAGTGVPIGTTFNFTVTFDRNQGVFPNAPNLVTRNLSIQAGAAAQGGICQFVDGGFTPAINANNVFNAGTLVTVTEVASPNTTVTSIRTTSGGALTANIPGRSGTLPILAGRLNNGTFDAATTEIEFVNSAAVAPIAQPREKTAYDFDGDKKADISVFRDGNWYMNRSRDGFFATQFGATTDRLVSADYDGDGKADVAVFRGDANKAYFYVLGSTTGFKDSQFGIGTDIPVPADFDGDGKADLAVYRNGATAGAASYIFYRPSSEPGVNFRAIQLGAKGDIPVVGDYDGDGKADAAVYRPSDGVWYMLRSRDGFTAVQFGISTDLPVVADYDGDGKADPAVYRNGTWYLLRSKDGFTGVQFGNPTDMPVPADLDADGKDDIAVYRSGTWFWLESHNNGFKSMNFGITSDVPVFCPPSHQQ